MYQLHRIYRQGAIVCLLVTSLVIAAKGFQAQAPFDVVLSGGRVMDPETNLDAVRHIGIRDERIVEISSEPLIGNLVVDVSGLVVAPGFIDPHAHGQTNQANEYQVRDGVTTALELESGVPYLKAWLDSRTGNALINFGATIAHSALRWESAEVHREVAGDIRASMDHTPLSDEQRRVAGEGVFEMRYRSLTASEQNAIGEGLSQGFREGALGIGVPVGYYPGADREEIYRLYELAATMDVPVYTHVRDPNLSAIQEAIANGVATGASVHIVHMNSMALGRIGIALDMVEAAQRKGFDITTELYPYTAGSTSLQSTLFDDGWQEVWGMDYNDLQWVETGERLTKETFEEYRPIGGTIIIHMMEEEWIDEGLRREFTMIGSDGMPYTPGAHPRSAGTYSRILGRYVRERAVLSLMEALRKMTLMPAQRLESMAPSMRRKGRVQIDCDADLTIFDPETVIDTATFVDDLSFSKGIHHVLVNGVFVVRDSKTVDGVFPGRAIVGKYRN